MCRQTLTTLDGTERHRRFYLAVARGRVVGRSCAPLKSQHLLSRGKSKRDIGRPCKSPVLPFEQLSDGERGDKGITIAAVPRYFFRSLLKRFDEAGSGIFAMQAAKLAQLLCVAGLQRIKHAAMLRFRLRNLFCQIDFNPNVRLNLIPQH
jgi:hypothetical protein